jgi:hypothetical protein
LCTISCASAPPPAPPPEQAKIDQFYTTDSVIAKGVTTKLCYGVSNAKAVRIEPALERLWPTQMRCIEASPTTTTTYTLFAATTEGGPEVSQTTTITVDPALIPAPPPGAPAADVQLIRFFIASSSTVAPGQQFTLCYSTVNNKTLELTPPLAPVAPSDRACFQTAINATTTFRLKATNAIGQFQQSEVKITVR